MPSRLGTEAGAVAAGGLVLHANSQVEALHWPPDGRSPFMRWLTLLVLLAGCSLPAPSTPEVETVGAAAPGLRGLDRLINRGSDRARDAHGLASLRWSAQLAAAATKHSEDMAWRGYFNHVSPDGATPADRAEAEGLVCETPVQDGVRRVGVLENLYLTTAYERIRERRTGDSVVREVDWFTAGEIAARVVQGWLDSPGHRENLLEGSAVAAGVGVAQAEDGRVYITQLLC